MKKESDGPGREEKIEAVWRDDADGKIKFFPNDRIPQDVPHGERTHSALEAFFSQPRRR